MTVTSTEYNWCVRTRHSSNVAASHSECPNDRIGAPIWDPLSDRRTAGLRSKSPVASRKSYHTETRTPTSQNQAQIRFWKQCTDAKMAEINGGMGVAVYHCAPFFPALGVSRNLRGMYHMGMSPSVQKCFLCVRMWARNTSLHFVGHFTRSLQCTRCKNLCVRVCVCHLSWDQERGARSWLAIFVPGGNVAG